MPATQRRWCVAKQTCQNHGDNQIILAHLASHLVSTAPFSSRRKIPASNVPTSSPQALHSSCATPRGGRGLPVPRPRPPHPQFRTRISRRRLVRPQPTENGKRKKKNSQAAAARSTAAQRQRASGGAPPSSRTPHSAATVLTPLRLRERTPARARVRRDAAAPLPLLHTPQTMRVSAHAALPSRSSQQQQRLSPHGEPRQGRLLTGAAAPRPPPGRARRQRRAAREEVGGGAPQTGKGGSQSGGRGVGGG